MCSIALVEEGDHIIERFNSLSCMGKGWFGTEVKDTCNNYLYNHKGLSISITLINSGFKHFHKEFLPAIILN